MILLCASYAGIAAAALVRNRHILPTLTAPFRSRTGQTQIFIPNGPRFTLP